MTPLLTERYRDRLRGVLSFLLGQGAGNRQKRDHVDEPPISIAAASVIAEHGRCLSCSEASHGAESVNE
jgi:hypothetical protein